MFKKNEKKNENQLFTIATPKKSVGHDCKTCKYCTPTGNSCWSCDYGIPKQIVKNDYTTSNYFWCNGRFYEFNNN